MPKKILQITHKPAYPSIDGGCLEMAKMAQFYQKNQEFELHIFTLFTHKHPFNQEEFVKAGIPANNITATKTNTKPKFWKGLATVLAGKSYNLSRFSSKDILNKLSEVLANTQFDLIQCESIYSGQFVEHIKNNSNAKIILNTPNVEFEIWNQYSHTSIFPKKQLFGQLSKLLKKEEIEIWNKMDALFCISKEVKSEIFNYCKVPSKIIPFFVEITEKPILKKKNASLSFFHIGAMDWKPNKEGVAWFLKNVWQHTTHFSPLHLAGKGMKLPLKKNESIVEHGFVENAKKFILDHDVMVVPLFKGSGMRIKIIEAMALGKCVISSSLGAEGIAYKKNQSILIADTAQEFITHINTLQQSPDKAEQIGNNAYELIKEKYSTLALEKEIIPFLNSVIHSAK